MNTNRKNAIWAGIFYIIATVAPISTFYFIGFLGGGVAGEPIADYLVNVSPNESQVIIGMLIEWIYVLAVVGIIATLLPILKKHNEALALGFFSLRFIEAICIIIGSIGVGWQGGSNMYSFLREKDCQIAAICDVDKNHSQDAVNRVNSQYQNEDYSTYADCRELPGCMICFNPQAKEVLYYQTATSLLGKSVCSPWHL